MISNKTRNANAQNQTQLTRPELFDKTQRQFILDNLVEPRYTSSTRASQLKLYCKITTSELESTDAKNLLTQILPKPYDVLDASKINEVTEAIFRHHAPTEYLYALAFSAAAGFVLVNPPSWIKNKPINNQAATASCLLNETEQLALDSAFYYVRDNQLAREGSFCGAKYKTIAYLLLQAGIYPENSNKIKSIRGHDDIQIAATKEKIKTIDQTENVNRVLKQLTNLLSKKVAVICAQRNSDKPEGAKSEGLIKELIVELAFRKLYLALKNINNLPNNWFSTNKNRLDHKAFKNYKGDTDLLISALKECKNTVSIYNSSTIQQLSIVQSESTLLGKLIQQLENTGAIKEIKKGGSKGTLPIPTSTENLFAL